MDMYICTIHIAMTIWGGFGLVFVFLHPFTIIIYLFFYLFYNLKNREKFIFLRAIRESLGESLELDIRRVLRNNVIVVIIIVENYCSIVIVHVVVVGMDGDEFDVNSALYIQICIHVRYNFNEYFIFLRI